MKGWSKTQTFVALSSGESELYATLKAAAETLGMLSMMKDLGWEMAGEVRGGGGGRQRSLGNNPSKRPGKNQAHSHGVIVDPADGCQKRIKLQQSPW